MQRWIAAIVGSMLVAFGAAAPATAQLIGGGLTAQATVRLGAEQLKNGGFETISGGVPANWSTGGAWSADQLINQEASTLVPGTRQSAMNALQLLMADELPTVPLYFRPNVTAASNRLANWKPEYASNGYTWNVWEWDLR